MVVEQGTEVTDADDILHRLQAQGTVAAEIGRPAVVCRHRVVFPFEFLVLQCEILDPGLDVGPHFHAAEGARHHLEVALGPGPGGEVGVAARFVAADRLGQQRVEIVFFAGVHDRPLDLHHLAVDPEKGPGELDLVIPRRLGGECGASCGLQADQRN